MAQLTQLDRILRAVDPRRSLRAQTALAFGALTILLAVLISLLVERGAQADLQEASGGKLAELAYYVTDALDRDLSARYQDLELLAISELFAPDASADARQRMLARFHTLAPQYAWIGVVDTSGVVLAEVGDRPGGDEPVTALPWFNEAQQQPYVGTLAAAADSAAAPTVTLAIPVQDAGSGQTAVLGAYLDPGWMARIAASLRLPDSNQGDVEVLVLAEDGRFLFGSGASADAAACTVVVTDLPRGENGYRVTTGAAGQTFLIGYAGFTPPAALTGEPWQVVTCQEAGQALAPVQAMQRRVLLLGSGLSLLFLLLGWLVAGRVTQPLTAIAQAAKRLQQGETDAAIPIYANENEVGLLSHTLYDLVSSLGQRTAVLGATEAELQEVNNTLQTIIQSVPLAIFLLDLDGVAHAWNAAAREMFRWSADLKTPPNPMHRMQHEPAFREMLQRVLAGETITNADRQYIQHDGALMHINMAMAPIYDAQGNPAGAVTVLTDVTERKRAETQLRDAHRTLAILMSNLPGMAYRRHPGSPYPLSFVSDGCFQLTGYAREALLADEGVQFTGLIHAQDRAGVFAEIEQAIGAKRPYQCTYRITTAGGHERWVWEQGEAVFADNGTLQALEGFITDNTGQVIAQQELAQRVADRTRKLSVLNDVLRLTNTTDDVAATLHQAIERMLAATHGEIGYVHLLDEQDLIYLAAQVGLPPAVAESLASMPVEPARKACSWVVAHDAVLTIPQVRADGRSRHLAEIPTHLHAYTGVPLAAGHKVVGVLSLIGETMTQFGDEEIELMAAVGRQIGSAIETARLRQQEGHLMVLQERNRLARDLHDSVTQSLYSLVLFAEAGRRKLTIGEIEQAADYLNRVNDTGQQALKEMRLFIHKLRPLALQEEGLVQALRQRLNAVEGRSGIAHELVVEGALHLPPQLEEALYHISQEALNNALKHARASRVRVYLAVAAEQVTMEIKDDGVGFDVAETAAASDGIGLKSMRERVELYNGTVVLESTPAQGPRQGTTVRVSLPLSQ